MSDSHTAQEIYNEVVSHLRQQGRKANFANTDDGLKRCLYRAADGCKCAVGCLIRDDEYNPKMEYKTIRDLLTGTFSHISPESMKERLTPHLDLISMLQRIHDGCSVGDWEAQFKYVASTRGLVYTPPGKA